MPLSRLGPFGSNLARDRSPHAFSQASAFSTTDFLATMSQRAQYQTRNELVDSSIGSPLSLRMYGYETFRPWIVASAISNEAPVSSAHICDGEAQRR